MNGVIVPLDKIPDEVFASGALGKGVGIQPSDGNVYAPFSGRVTMIFPTKHAIGLTSDSGIELLIHCGLETVNLNGVGFELKVKDGQAIKQGDLLVTMNLDMIKEKRFETITPVIITNSHQYHQVDQAGHGEVRVGESLLITQ